MEEVCEGETAESSSILTITFPQGESHGRSSKEHWDSKEHSLKTTLQVSLEWQEDVPSLSLRQAS